MTQLLADRTWTELESRWPVVLVPMGSCEQHGPHLPLDTDAAIATAVGERALALLHGGTDAVLAPAQNYGASGEHEGFPGTVSIGHTALHLVVVELGRSLLRWAKRVVLVNGHGGNLPSLAGAVRRLRSEGRDAAWWAWESRESDAHAGHTETSLMYAIRPSSVQIGLSVSGPGQPLEDLLDRLKAVGVRPVSPTGVLGEPAGATAAEGHELLASMATDLAAAVEEWNVDSAGRVRGAPKACSGRRDRAVPQGSGAGVPQGSGAGVPQGSGAGVDGEASWTVRSLS